MTVGSEADGGARGTAIALYSTDLRDNSPGTGTVINSWWRVSLY